MPRFVDVDPCTGLIDLADADDRVGDSTRGVIPVHLYGRAVEMAPVLAFADEHDLLVVEDAAQAHGARRDGRAAGTWGRAGTFSFYPGKNLGAFGDGGAIATDDGELADQLRLLRDHGKRGDEHLLVGGNHRLDALQAAVLGVKLPRMETGMSVAAWPPLRYRDLLPADVLDWDGAADAEAEVHHLFPIMADDRDALIEALAGEGIATGVHYRQALPDTQAFAGSTDDCPVASARAARQLSLPMHPHLSAADIERVAEAVTRLTR